MQAPVERLGAFYLGAEYDLNKGERSPVPVNYDARDLTTHAVCVGMTGSGKTGLCIDLLEEAAIDKVPAIIIDPKGDMTNLLLQFPELRPEDFRPWVNPDDARRKGMTLDEYAKSIADLWRNGLADWGQTSERVRMVKESVEYTIYTPGSDAGMPISIMGSLAAPGLDFEENAEAIRDHITGTVAALLSLVGIDADPIRSREAILLSNIFEHFWRQGEDLDLAKLILSIQNPPVRQLGVFDVDTFYPQKDRFEMAMAFNNLMAAPAFQSWLEGEDLDIDRLLYTESGQPRHSVFYIAHLSESERMFFVTLLLEAVVSWMRRQSGTTSLRALLYFDEIFGFFPPVKEPPSKRPLLTILKQARAFGLGAILVTQNPVDIDYKGLTNAGTWFIGKLQAERDKDRVVQGLKGAIAEAGQGDNQIDYDAVINNLSSRIFLMHNVHEGAPTVFHTRWAMSYLRGPLTRPQVRILMAERKRQAAMDQAGHVASVAAAPPIAQSTLASPPTPKPAPEPESGVKTAEAPAGFSPTPPALDPSVAQVYLPVTMSEQEAIRWVADETGRDVDVKNVQLIYEPGLLGAATVRYVDRKHGIDEQREQLLLTQHLSSLASIDWSEAEALPISLADLERRPSRVPKEEGPYFGSVPEEVNTERELRSIAKDFSDWLYYNSRLPLKAHTELGIWQQPGESERAFKIRLQDAARERRDEEVDKLRHKYQTRIERVEAKLRKYERNLAEDEAEYSARKQQEYISIGETVLNLFLGRRSSRALSTAASKRRMSSRAKLEIEQTKQEIEDLKDEIQELNSELEQAAEEITQKWANLLDEVTVAELKPRRADVDVELVALAWIPSWLVMYDDGIVSRSAAVAAYPLPEQPKTNQA